MDRPLSSRNFGASIRSGKTGLGYCSLVECLGDKTTQDPPERVVSDERAKPTEVSK